MIKAFQTLSILFFVFLNTGCFEEKPRESSISKSAGEKARIKTAKGDIVFEFEEKTAPATVARVKKLIHDGFYNGLIFHRVVKDFIIQTGDPTGSGRGGSGLKLKPEFSDLKHREGTISMARSSDINSADSQFFITLGDFPHLDNEYTIFAHVTEGIEVAKKIGEGDKILTISLETKSSN